MKKFTHILFVIGALVLIPSLSMAQNVSATTYVGAYGGYAMNEGFSNNINSDIEADGLDFGAFAGFRFETLSDSNTSFTASFEAFLGSSFVEGNVGNVSLEKNYEYGISFRPGLAFKPTQNLKINPYAILGYRISEFESRSANVTANRDFDGFELGVGTNLLTFDNIDLRFEYSHIFWGEEAGFEPDEDSLRLGLVYNFKTY